MKYMMQELEVWYIIPALRRDLAIEMRKLGIKSVDIAEKLGVTKAAVSQYFHNSRAVGIKFDKDMSEKIKKSAAKIVEGSNCISEIQNLLRFSRNSRAVCGIHKNKESVEKNCNLCFNLK